MENLHHAEATEGPGLREAPQQFGARRQTDLLEVQHAPPADGDKLLPGSRDHKDHPPQGTDRSLSPVFVRRNWHGDEHDPQR